MKDKKKHGKADHKKNDRPAERIKGAKDQQESTGPGSLRLGSDCRYLHELRRLQIELVKLQEWVRQERLRVVVLFEGRDAAGKGGTIKRITESLNPRVCRVVALATPTERERTQ